VDNEERHMSKKKRGVRSKNKRGSWAESEDLIVRSNEEEVRA
jgi:hypothetical protein